MLQFFFFFFIHVTEENDEELAASVQAVWGSLYCNYHKQPGLGPLGTGSWKAWGHWLPGVSQLCWRLLGGQERRVYPPCRWCWHPIYGRLALCPEKLILSVGYWALFGFYLIIFFLKQILYGWTATPAPVFDTWSWQCSNCFTCFKRKSFAFDSYRNVLD